MSGTSVPCAHVIFAARRLPEARLQAWRWFALILAVVMPAVAADLEVEARDLVARRCLGCHGPKSKVAGLDLSTRETALKGGSKGPALKPGAANESLLIARVDKGEMPPTAPLPPEE